MGTDWSPNYEARDDLGGRRQVGEKGKAQDCIESPGEYKCTQLRLLRPMKTLSRFLVGSLLVVALSPVWVKGQNAPGANRQRLLIQPGAPSQGGESKAATLSANYTVTLTVLQDDKPVGEVVVLTASPKIVTNVPLDVKNAQASVSASGELSEGENGKMVFVYSLGFSVPVVTKSVVTPQAGGGVPMPGNVQYQQHQSSGSVLAKLGRPYDLLKAGGYVYRVTIDKAKDE